jgi:ankyrin repeat protein
MEYKNYDGKTSFLEACSLSNIQLMKELYKCGANPNTIAGGGSAIHWFLTNRNILSFEKKIEGITFLLEVGCNINYQDWSGNTPLHISTYLGDLETSLILIKFGANPEIKNINGKNVYQNIAVFYNKSLKEYSSMQKKLK